MKKYFNTNREEEIMDICIGCKECNAMFTMNGNYLLFFLNKVRQSELMAQM